MKTELEFIFSWHEAIPAGVEKVGGKGWNLGRIARYGFKIPSGFVLSTEAYNQFIQHNRLTGFIDEISQSITLTNLDEYNDQFSQLREKIMTGSIPVFLVEELSKALLEFGIGDKPLAVRSSASMEDAAQMSFAGIHESFLNVYGREQVLTSIKDCYASLWSPQAVAYRRRFNLSDQQVVPAVVIMEMVAARAAGVAFSCDPQTGRRDRLVVHANFGLGESVVNGAVEPDSYYLDASAWYAIPRLVDKKIGCKEGQTKIKSGGGTVFINTEDSAAEQVLKDAEIENLGLLILRVFESLGEGEQHQDIEWAFDGQDFFLLQARPVTALPCYTFDGFRGQQEVWSNGNYRDALPMVLSPLHRQLMKSAIDTLQYTSLSAVAYPIPEGFQFSRFFNGRLYCNISALQWAYYDCSGMLPRDFNPFLGGHQPDIEVDDTDPYQGEQGQIRQERTMQSFALVMEASTNANRTFAQVIRSIETIIAGGFATISDRNFIDKYNQLGQVVKDYSEKFNFLAGAGNMSLVMLLQALAGHLGDRTMMVINGLMVGGEAGITSADHGYRLVELAQIAQGDEAARQFLESDNYNPLQWEQQLPEGSLFKKEFRKFIGEFGHRGVYELDIINPRWHEDPSYLFEMIKSTMAEANLEQWKARQAEIFDRAWQEVADKVPANELEAIKQGIKDAQEGAAVKEMTKSVLVIALEAYRKLALQLGNRFKQRGLLIDVNDIFFCSWPDLIGILNGEWNGDELRILVADRQTVHKQKDLMAAPDLIMGEKPVFSQALLHPSGNYLQGVGAATGKASGLARLINHPAEGNRLLPGEILVAPSTDPGWTPLFLKTSALIMETGGFLSHGAIVAREYGVPAVVNVPGVMRQLEDGQQVIVDGDEGRVYLSFR